MAKIAFRDRIKHAWNAFANRDPTDYVSLDLGPGYSYRPGLYATYGNNERSIVTNIYSRIAIDVASTTIQHVRVNDSGQYEETINSGLNNILTLEANKDQTSFNFIEDIVISMCDEGCVAVVPIDTTDDPTDTSSYDIETMRTGKITQWYKDEVKVEVYNDRTGNKEEILMPKSAIAIIENPLYAIMNEPNSILQRLIRKLSLLDAIDESNGAGKLDLIVQLPYVIKSKARQLEAEKRRREIEEQLEDSKYGVAYTDGTEKITQLNRSVDNQLLSQVEYLTKQLYDQLGITNEILNGTAEERVMLNYYNRTIDPILNEIKLEFKRKFLTKTARTQGQSIEFFRDPFKLVPVKELSTMADTFTRNAILSTNEFRSILKYKPDPNMMSNELINKNLYPVQEELNDMAVDGEQQEDVSPADMPVSALG